jgi:hypothetical protein
VYSKVVMETMIRLALKSVLGGFDAVKCNMEADYRCT